MPVATACGEPNYKRGEAQPETSEDWLVEFDGDISVDMAGLRPLVEEHLVASGTPAAH